MAVRPGFKIRKNHTCIVSWVVKCVNGGKGKKREKREKKRGKREKGKKLARRGCG